MQFPLLVFDHIRKQVVTVQTGRGADKRIAELLGSQHAQVATSGKPSS
jgi:hypothetical protein